MGASSQYQAVRGAGRESVGLVRRSDADAAAALSLCSFAGASASRTRRAGRAKCDLHPSNSDQNRHEHWNRSRAGNAGIFESPRRNGFAKPPVSLFANTLQPLARTRSARTRKSPAHCKVKTRSTSISFVLTGTG